MISDESDQPTTMGEGNNPEEELKGWQNKMAWGKSESSEVPADNPNAQKINPKCGITRTPLIEVGRTARKNRPIYLSEADNVPEGRGTGGALNLWKRNNGS